MEDVRKTDERYETGFADGVRSVVDLIRSGADIESVAAFLPMDPGLTDPGTYQTHLGELRRIMGTDQLFSGVVSQDQQQEIPGEAAWAAETIITG